VCFAEKRDHPAPGHVLDGRRAGCPDALLEVLPHLQDGVQAAAVLGPAAACKPSPVPDRADQWYPQPWPLLGLMSFRGHRSLSSQMNQDEQQIRTLIESWADAVHAGDLETVVAAHAVDIIMFDVPPPYDGVRGIEAYRATWPPFFRFQLDGASFEIVSLDVTAGEDVAYAHALLRCGTPEELAEKPENRLRLTLGLLKEDGRWVVAHEHHSFPLDD
jgi:uncharacterized protein (TIGR02246 family)